MTKPKYKETGLEKFRRQGGVRTHIYWSSIRGEWLYAMCGMDRKASQFCREQDNRWTPRSKK